MPGIIGIKKAEADDPIFEEPFTIHISPKSKPSKKGLPTATDGMGSASAIGKASEPMEKGSPSGFSPALTPEQETKVAENMEAFIDAYASGGEEALQEELERRLPRRSKKTSRSSQGRTMGANDASYWMPSAPDSAAWNLKTQVAERKEELEHSRFSTEVVEEMMELTFGSGWREHLEDEDEDEDPTSGICGSYPVPAAPDSDSWCLATDIAERLKQFQEDGEPPEWIEETMDELYGPEWREYLEEEDGSDAPQEGA